MSDQNRVAALGRAAGIGAVTGLAGAAVMIVTQKLEQAITDRPDSYIPGRALLALFGHRPAERDRTTVSNQIMHFGTGAVLGALRGMWAVTGILSDRLLGPDLASRRGRISH